MTLADARAIRSRPGAQVLLDRVDAAMAELAGTGRIPAPSENPEVWRDIWFEEAHHSTAIEGNALDFAEVRTLLEEGRAVGEKMLRDYLEVAAYAAAAAWIYRQGRSPSARASSRLVTAAELQLIHEVAVRSTLQAAPPIEVVSDQHVEDFRRRDTGALPGVTPRPAWRVSPEVVTDWLARINEHAEGDEHPLVRLAIGHAEFERLRPFSEGNGRVGRLVLNLLLVRLGFAPAIIRKRDRPAYRTGLRRADAGDPAPLVMLLTRAVEASLDRFRQPDPAAPMEWLPLSTFAATNVTLRALREAATRGRLQAVRDPNGYWVSSKEWVDAYLSSRQHGPGGSATTTSGRQPSTRAAALVNMQGPALEHHTRDNPRTRAARRASPG